LRASQVKHFTFVGTLVCLFIYFCLSLLMILEAKNKTSMIGLTKPHGELNITNKIIT